MQKKFSINTIAILGSGVMGAQIAAQCINAGFETLLYDLPAKEGELNGIVNKAIQNLSQLKPSAFANKNLIHLLKPKNYTENLSELRECDLIIEAIAEKLDWKTDLYEKISPYLSEKNIFVTNTSGLCINTLAKSLPQSLQNHFCGIHFFNPPRYMHLAELIPTSNTNKELLDNLETWLTRFLGKGVVRAKDTPNFIANRIGVFSLLSILHHAKQFNLPIDEVDALTGSLLGRPKSATFRTMDIVGLDTMQNVVNNMQNTLRNDPWYEYFQLPQWINKLIEKKYLGQKSGQGFYRKINKYIEVYDPQTENYRIAKGQVNINVQKIFASKNPVEIINGLKNLEDVQAKFLLACYCDLMHYCGYHLEGIANCAADVDLAMQWGFGWKNGPFTIWQSLGVQHFAQEIINQQIIDLKKAPMPKWLADCNDFYNQQGFSFDPVSKNFINRSGLQVYERQIKQDFFKPEYANSSIELRIIDDVGVLNFNTKANCIGTAVLDGINHAILQVKNLGLEGLVFHQFDVNNFSSGADLKSIMAYIEAKNFNDIEAMINQFQTVLLNIKFADFPTVAAVSGRALGGGCELMLHCSAIVAALESYPGLVEIGVGVIPAGGGCKEMARRAALTGDCDFSLLQKYFQNIAQAKVATSAMEAREMGYIQPSDHIIMNYDEILYTSIAKVKLMKDINYHKPQTKLIKVAGISAHARIQLGLVNWLEGKFITEHEYHIANLMAKVLTGGDLAEGTEVDEQWFLNMERQAFMELIQNQLTQERIKHLLTTGKPLRN